MEFEENNPLINAIADKAFSLCFKQVFHKKGGVKATEKEDLQMELCLFNYMQTYQQVLKFICLLNKKKTAE